MSKISKLEKQVSNVEKQKESCRVKVYYHEQKMKDAVKNNKEADYSKHAIKLEFYNKRLSELEQQLSEAKALLTAAKNEEAEKKHKKEVMKFKLELVEYLKVLVSTIKEGNYKDAFYQAQDIKEFIEQNPEYHLDIAKVTQYFSMQTAIIMLSKIVDDESDAIRVFATRGRQISQSVRKDLVDIPAKNLMGILQSSIKELEK